MNSNYSNISLVFLLKLTMVLEHHHVDLNPS